MMWKIHLEIIGGRNMDYNNMTKQFSAYSALFNLTPNSTFVRDGLSNKVTVLLNSTLASNFAHFANWLAKISIQTRQTKYCLDYTSNISDLLQEELGSKLFAEITNRDETTKINAAFRKDQGNRDLKKQFAEAASKSFLTSAFNILSQAKSYEVNKTR